MVRFLSAGTHEGLKNTLQDEVTDFLETVLA